VGFLTSGVRHALCLHLAQQHLQRLHLTFPCVVLVATNGLRSSRLLPQPVTLCPQRSHLLPRLFRLLLCCGGQLSVFLPRRVQFRLQHRKPVGEGLVRRLRLTLRGLKLRHQRRLFVFPPVDGLLALLDALVGFCRLHRLAFVAQRLPRRNFLQQRLLCRQTLRFGLFLGLEHVRKACLQQVVLRAAGSGARLLSVDVSPRQGLHFVHQLGELFHTKDKARTRAGR